MARNTDRSTSRRSPKDAARRTKKKPCALCRDKVEWVDYKDVDMLRKYMSDRGKIRARRVSGNCTQHQREVAIAIKTARELVLLPYTQRMMTERSAGRGRGGRGQGRGGPGGDSGRDGQRDGARGGGDGARERSDSRPAPGASAAPAAGAADAADLQAAAALAATGEEVV